MSNDMVASEEKLPEISDEMLGDDVLGYSEKQEDSLIPVLNILQDNSGEVKKKHDRYIEGAEPGNLVIRALQAVYGEEDEVLFQPCGFSHVWVEWTGEPGEGGAPVAQYQFEERPAEAEEVENRDGKKEWRMPSGNRLVETRHHFGHLIVNGEEPLPAVMPMSGTNHSVSRQWTSLMKRHRTASGKKAPAFSRLYDVETKFSQSGAQSWYKYKISDRGWVHDERLLRDGFEFAKAVAASEVTADVAGDGPADDSDDIPV